MKPLSNGLWKPRPRLKAEATLFFGKCCYLLKATANRKSLWKWVVSVAIVEPFERRYSLVLLEARAHFLSALANLISLPARRYVLYTFL